MGAGKTTFYDAHLKEAFPTLIPPVPHIERVRCFASTARLRSRIGLWTRDCWRVRGRQGYTTKVLFISTEDPDLDVRTRATANESKRAGRTTRHDSRVI